MNAQDLEALFDYWLTIYFDAPDPKHKPLAQYLARRMHRALIEEAMRDQRRR